MICWRTDIVELNKNTNEFVSKGTTEINSEAFFSDKRIRINDVELYLNIKSIQSKSRTPEGTVTIYNTVTDSGLNMTATVVSDSRGIFKLFTLQEGLTIGLVFYLKNR